MARPCPDRVRPLARRARARLDRGLLPADFSSRRRQIFQAKLTATETYFKSMLSKAPFKPQVDVPRMQAAVIDPGLVEALAEILDIYALYGISRDFERLDETNGLLAPDL